MGKKTAAHVRSLESGGRPIRYITTSGAGYVPSIDTDSLVNELSNEYIKSRVNAPRVLRNKDIYLPGLVRRANITRNSNK